MIELNPREVNAMGLLNCPFCGGDAGSGCEFGLTRMHYFGRCTVCGARGQSFPEDEGGASAAASAWNRRAASPVAADTMGDAPPLSDDQIKAIAQQWFTTGENQLRADGYYYRSLGTVTNVRESDLIAFAREVLARAAAWPALREAIANAPTIRAAITEGKPDA